MFANEHGIVVCLLNRWHVTPKDASPVQPAASRGKVVLELSAISSLTEIAEQLPALSLGAKPYELVAFSQNQRVAFTWDGQKLSPFKAELPLTSSSFQFEEVKAARQKAYSETSSLEQFQGSQNKDCSAYTVRMNRPDAQTWSRSHLRITADRIRWDYWEEFPNLTRAPKLHQIELARTVPPHTERASFASPS